MGISGAHLENEPSSYHSRFLLELLPSNPPYIASSLLGDPLHRTVEELIEMASDRDKWRESRPPTMQEL